MAARAPTTAPLTAAAAVLRARRAAVLDAWLACVGLPPDGPADAVRADVAEALGRSLDALVTALECPGQDDRAALAFLRAHVRRTVLRGVRGPSLLRWCHQLERLVSDEVAATADPAELLAVARRVMGFVEALNEVCADAYEATQAAIDEAGDVLRGRLVEALVHGGDPGSPVLQRTAEACGLGGGRSVAVAVVRRDVPFADAGEAALAVSAVAGAGARDGGAAAVVGDDVVLVVPAVDAAVGTVVQGLRAAHRRIGGEGVAVRTGVSVVHATTARAPEAHREALLALGLTSAERPVVALSEQSALDYLVLRGGDRTAWKLVPHDVRRLLADPSEEARGLAATASALAACDGNVRSAAFALRVHPNTVHSRLTKVHERTGLDLRRFEDLAAFVLAIRLSHTRA